MFRSDRDKAIPDSCINRYAMLIRQTALAACRVFYVEGERDVVQLLPGDGRVRKIIQLKNLPEQQNLRLSRWVYFCREEDSILLRSSLSKQVYQLNPDEWDSVCRGDLSSHAVEELAENRFLVEEGFDDLAQYAMVIAVLKNLEKKKPGANAFTILPTTGCNARCVYCYQQGIPVRTMTPEVAEKTIEYICVVKREGPVKLHWFGGEPLCAPEIISGICRGLQERNVEFTSSITTNGSLFTPELVREAVALWHLERAQVSMDGAREDYEARKRYVRPDLYNYDVVMNHIRMLAEAGVKVAIRCNCDLNSMPGVYGFIDECAVRFLDTGNVHLVPALLKQDMRESGTDFAVYAGQSALAEYAARAGFPQKDILSSSLATYRCMADSGGRHRIIDPLGGLHVCEDRVGGVPLGSIFDKAQPAWPTCPLTPAKECQTCCFLPDCTAYNRNGCPLCPADCKVLTEREMSRKLTRLLKKHFDEAAFSSAETDEERCQ